jgi:hypothetical protein
LQISSPSRTRRPKVAATSSVACLLRGHLLGAADGRALERFADNVSFSEHVLASPARLDQRRILEEAWSRLLRQLDRVGKIDTSESMADATFCSAKKGRMRWQDQTRQRHQDHGAGRGRWVAVGRPCRQR